jgi:O-antigen ligase
LKKIYFFEKWLFYIFLFCIPFQTRIILHQWTHPFNEWTSAFLYLSDILLIGVFVLWALRIKDIRSSISELWKLTWFKLLVIFFAISAISIFYSSIPNLSFYRLAKLLEFILLLLYFRANINKLLYLNTVVSVIVASGIFQAVIAMIQYSRQGSIGLKFFGESHIGTNIYNVAVFFGTNGVKYLRAYGTTPHPNVLAAFFVLTLFAFYYWYLIPIKKQINRLWVLVGYGLMLVGLFLTFSRTMIGIWGLAVIAGYVIAKDYRKRLLSIIISTVVIGLLFAILFWPQVQSRIHISGDEEAVTQRVFYNEIAGKVTTSSPIFGVGIGQSVVDLMHRFRYHPQYFYQPTHNIYLLISSETGFPGLIAFLFFLFFLYWQLFKNKHFLQITISILIFSFSFLLIGLFDHFLWTLQQGSLVFWLSLAILTIKSE